MSHKLLFAIAMLGGERALPGDYKDIRRPMRATQESPVFVGRRR